MQWCMAFIIIIVVTCLITNSSSAQFKPSHARHEHSKGVWFAAEMMEKLRKTHLRTTAMEEYFDGYPAVVLRVHIQVQIQTASIEWMLYSALEITEPRSNRSIWTFRQMSFYRFYLLCYIPVLLILILLIYMFSRTRLMFDWIKTTPNRFDSFLSFHRNLAVFWIDVGLIINHLNWI